MAEEAGLTDISQQPETDTEFFDRVDPGTEQPVEESSSPEPVVETADEGTSTTAEQMAQAPDPHTSGLLNEITNLREMRRQDSEAIASMREMFMDLEQRNAEAERLAEMERREQEDMERYGADVVNDPTVQYIRDKMAQLDDTMYAAEQQRYAQQQQVAEQAAQWQQQQQQQEILETTVKTQEEVFREANPDYDEAYKYARSARTKMYTDRGYDPGTAERMVNQEELYLMAEQLGRGASVPEQIYNLAQTYGYQPVKVEKVQPEQKQLHDTYDDGDIQRITQGLSSQGVGQVPGGASGKLESPGGREMSAEEFFSTVPAQERLRIFMQDDTAFERLGRTGKIFVKN